MYTRQTRLPSCPARRCANPSIRGRQDSIKLSVSGRRAIDWRMELWRLLLAPGHMWGARPSQQECADAQHSRRREFLRLFASSCFTVSNLFDWWKSAIMAAVKKCSVPLRDGRDSHLSPLQLPHVTQTRTWQKCFIAPWKCFFFLFACFFLMKSADSLCRLLLLCNF